MYMHMYMSHVHGHPSFSMCMSIMYMHVYTRLYVQRCMYVHTVQEGDRCDKRRFYNSSLESDDGSRRPLEQMEEAEVSVRGAHVVEGGRHAVAVRLVLSAARRLVKGWGG